MTTIEQRINYFHLLDGVIAHKIEGDVIELGCFTGECAILFGEVMRLRGAEKPLHLYDSFSISFKAKGNIAVILQDHFKQRQLPPPVLHKGYFEETLPDQLPARLAFVHIDCGFGGAAAQHQAVVLHCLQSVYPRMSPGAVCVLMDYHDESAGDGGLNFHPGVKLACDEFFANKAEEMTSLYGNQYSHGFFRKI